MTRRRKTFRKKAPARTGLGFSSFLCFKRFFLSIFGLIFAPVACVKMNSALFYDLSMYTPLYVSAHTAHLVRENWDWDCMSLFCNDYEKSVRPWFCGARHTLYTSNGWKGRIFN